MKACGPGNTAPPRKPGTASAQKPPPSGHDCALRPYCDAVPHLALGLLGIAVVLRSRMPEFAGVLFSGTTVSRLSVGERIGSTRGGFSYGLVRRAVKGAVVGR